MRNKVKIRIADPAGNITIFVLDSFERDQYQNVATKLLDIKEYNAEQVAFVKSPDQMEMCGLEFCGNASRSFALISAEMKGINGNAVVSVNVSGSDTPLDVKIDTVTNYTKIKMPSPWSIAKLEYCPVEKTNGSYLVDLGGIMHVVLHNVAATRETFDIIKDYIVNKYEPPAMGVMFYDDETGVMTPVVYVKDVDTTYFEGSCGSGSTAMAAALSQGLGDGTHSFVLTQPAGTITATSEIIKGRLSAIYIEGPVELSPEIEAEIEL